MKLKQVISAALLVACFVVAAPPPVQGVAPPRFVLDPNLTGTDKTNAGLIKTAITKAATEYGYTDFTAVIYAPTTAGASWAYNELSKISCPLGPVESMINGVATADLFFGKCIVIKATNISYPNVAKDTEQVAYHEVFHLAQALRGGLKTMGERFDDMRWMYEGTADIGGYQPQISSGGRTQYEIISLLRGYALKTQESLTTISHAMVDNSIALVSDPNDRTNAIYSRSYLAAYYLTSVSTKQKVMFDYFAEVGRSGDHFAAFQTTFGMSVAEYDRKFTKWLTAWKVPTLSSSKAAKFGDIALYAGLYISQGATVTAMVASSSNAICQVSGSAVKGIKKGTCRITVTATSSLGTKRSRAVSLNVTN
jgi:hypothetical protein